MASRQRRGPRVLIIAPTRELAWGEDGHRIVASIAEKHLTSRAKRAVERILSGKILASVAVWADDVRPTSKFRWTAPLHFVNVAKGATKYDAVRDCPKSCVVKAIDGFASTLLDPNASAEKKEEALKFLVHFVGDLHQPLHAGHFEDRGGNRIKVRFFGRDTNLHSLWDSGMIKRSRGSRSGDTYADDLNGTITNSEVDSWDGVPSDWATESYKLAVSNAYKIHNGQLGQDYFDSNIGIVEEQLKKGGVRLARLLNGIFG